jgi:mannose-6-phosphate isomerase-like protein (cupin superfamily)
VFRLTDTQFSIPGPDGKHFNTLLQRGTLKLLISLPVRPNVQAPHAQDELYVVVRGHGVLVHDGKRDRFTQGDAMFVSAGTEHHFEDFTDDLAVWVAFYGPQGGEA